MFRRDVPCYLDCKLEFEGSTFGGLYPFLLDDKREKVFGDADRT